MAHIQFEIVTTSAGAISIRDKITNEIMHNPVGPWLEANELYINQSRLKGRLLEEPLEQELVVFDIGLGAAANALAVIHCVAGMRGKNIKRVRLISFEKNLELLKFALENSQSFSHFEGYEKAIESILNKYIWISENIIWELRPGEFLDLIEEENQKPHIIFFDPYSPKVNNEMWTIECFSKIFKKSRKDTEGSTILYTYSQATPIRSALFSAGFYVGHGSGTGLKEETTQAATRLELLDNPLGARWFKRWKSSQTPYPFNTSIEQQELLREQILKHPQFV